MAFPLIPIIIAFALYVLHDDEESQSEIAPKVKKNKSVEITRSDIDDKANTVPDSPPPEPENSVPTVEIPETPPESENVQ